MPKPKKVIESEPVEGEVNNTSTDDPAEPEVNRTVRTSSNKITVTLPDGTYRVYSEFTHGRPWKDLAKNFAEAHGGKIS